MLCMARQAVQRLALPHHAHSAHACTSPSSACPLLLPEAVATAAAVAANAMHIACTSGALLPIYAAHGRLGG